MADAVFGTGVDAPTPVDVITGCGGILVEAALLRRRGVQLRRRTALGIFVDDIWISGHLARRRIPRCVIPSAAAFVYLPTLTALADTRTRPDRERPARRPQRRHARPFSIRLGRM